MHCTRIRAIDAGPIDAAHAAVYDVEIGGNWNSLLLPAERFWFAIEGRRPTASREYSFGGGQVEGSWILTGARRRYNLRNGAFQNPRPAIHFSRLNGSWDAWELAFRYSHVDLDDHPGDAGLALTNGGIRGGVQSIFSVWLNGCLTPNVKLLLSYLETRVDRLNPAGIGAAATPFGAGSATPPIGVDIGQDLRAFTLRSQFSF